MRSLLYAMLIVFAVTGVAAAQDLSSFNATAEKLAAAYKKGDAQTISEAYAEDARIFPPGREMIKGRDAIKAFWVEDVKGSSDLVVTTIDIKTFGDSDLREVGKFTGKTTGNDPKPFAGKYITIWQKSGDKWEIKDDIWNLDK
jgi:ketosteroid isomerase-like protein